MEVEEGKEGGVDENERRLKTIKFPQCVYISTAPCAPATTERCKGHGHFT